LVRIGITISGQKNLQWYADYFARIREHGGEPVALDPTSDPGRVVDEIDGLLLSGGADVSPALYGETPHPTVKSRPALDEMEAPLARLALDRGLPVLGICRGHQLLNVVYGGRLVQHIESGEHESHADAPGNTSRWHAARIDPESYLGRLVGKTDVEVNSRHHQGVLPEMVAPGLVATAWSPDGLVEGLERREPGGFVVSVQWHPERPEERDNFNPVFAPLFAAFVQAATAAKRPVR
jgi:gamma-glutamyl-gamma-aminobutyrate hydrolase PuuD